jgi:hypothetical protein
MTDKVNLDKELMKGCFSRLNDKLKAVNENGEVIIFDGAAMCLVYGSRGK